MKIDGVSIRLLDGTVIKSSGPYWHGLLLDDHSKHESDVAEKGFWSKDFPDQLLSRYQAARIAFRGKQTTELKPELRSTDLWTVEQVLQLEGNKDNV